MRNKTPCGANSHFGGSNFMKRLVTLVLAAGLVLSAASGAQAIEFKASGQWLMGFNAADGGLVNKKRAFDGTGAVNGMRKSNNNDIFSAGQRIRLQLDAIASESLSGTVFFELGDTTWGQASSGGALGVDTAAHKGALAAGGKTVAVLGCGLGANYLNENKSLRDVIKNNGALVTEYPPFTRASRTTFPMRNRLISGLSVGVLVVEASVKSGSLITANYALEQGRDVYAVPSSVLSVNFAGTNKLIDDGAIVATKPAQIAGAYAEKFDTIDMSKARSVEELMTDESDKSANVAKDENALSFEKLEENREKRLENEKIAAGLTGDVKTVYNCLSDCFVHIDTVIEKTGLPGASVMASVTQLEVLGLVQSTSGKRYKLS